MLPEAASEDTGAVAVAEPAAPTPGSERATNRTAGPQPGRIAHFLPSFADVAFLVPIIFLYLRGDGARTLLGDADTGWHLRTGQWILQNGRVPQNDIFSFTKSGQPWFAWEWLWDVVFAWMHLHWGLAAVAFTSTVMLGTVFYLVYRLAWWKSHNALVSIILTQAALAGSSVHWLARPHLTTWLFVVLFFWILEHDKSANTRRVLWLPVLMVFWTNLHGGFVAGLTLVGAYAAGEAAAALLESQAGARALAWASARRYGWLTAACAAASLVNPYGYKLHVHIAKYLADESIQKGIQEFLSYSFQHPMAKYVEGMILLAGVAVAWNVAQRRFVYPILLLMWGHAGLFSARHLPIFVILAAPIVAGCLTELGSLMRTADVAAWARRVGRGMAGFNSEVGEIEAIWRIPVLTILVIVMMAGLFWAGVGKFGARFDPKRFPVKAAEKLVGPQYATGVFSTDQWGDYLIYRHYPNVKVFIDGRSDFYGEAFCNRYGDAVDAKWTWSKTLDQNHVQTVLLPVDMAVTSALKESRNWRVVYDDHVAIIFERVASAPQAARMLSPRTELSAVTDGGSTAIFGSQATNPVVYGPQSYARRN